jgi:hypothetical protein
MTSLKRDKVCPHCEHRKFWFVSPVRVAVRNQDTLGANAPPLGVSVHSSWLGTQHKGEFEAFICAACGFTEWYATDLGRIVENPKDGVYFVDAEPKAGLR